MSISRQNLSIVIVTLRSESVIDQCIDSINEDLPIIIIENSNNSTFTKYLENKYKNIKCLLSRQNIGMGSGNNLGIKESKTDYVLVINPDVILAPNTIKELILASENISDFAILSPMSSNNNYPNYELDERQKKNENKDLPFNVKVVDGYAMLFNKRKINSIIFDNSLKKQNSFFDENFFMYLENNDLCKRLTEKGEKIFVAPKAKINHLGAKTVDQKYDTEIELSRNWHWIWSKFYFKKKHFGFLTAFIEGFPNFIGSMFKYIFYFLLNNKFKKDISFNRASGFFNALIGKSSWYRPNLDD